MSHIKSDSSNIKEVAKYLLLIYQEKERKCLFFQEAEICMYHTLLLKHNSGYGLMTYISALIKENVLLLSKIKQKPSLDLCCMPGTTTHHLASWRREYSPAGTPNRENVFGPVTNWFLEMCKGVLISRANHWRGLSGAPKMSKVPHHLLCDNYQKYKTYQSCLTATASKQGDRVLVLFPDAVNQHLLLSTFSSTLSSLFSPSRFPVTVQNPFPLSSQELCHVYLGIKHYFFLLVPFHMFSSSVCFVSVLADF